jgi:hypothetical protein
LIFKNLEEVKKVILTDVGAGNCAHVSGKTKWVLIVSSRIDASRIDAVTNARRTTPVA